MRLGGFHFIPARVRLEVMVSPTRPYVLLDKKLGQTPLQAIEAWKLEHPAHADLPASYAGRLDPMATGKLLVLLGDECKRQKAYHRLDKEYEIEVLLDLSTDTGDALGMPAYLKNSTSPSRRRVQDALNSETGSKTVPYPAFSSKTVNGKPLFLYALEGTLGAIEIPTHTEKIYRMQLLGMETIKKETLGVRIGDILSYAPHSEDPSKEIGADFRQDAIRASWKSLLEAIPERNFTLLRLRVTCASGTYMRTLAERIGKELGTSGMTVSIERTRIGTYRSIGSIGFWTREYR